MRATRVVYCDRKGEKHELLLPIMFPNDESTDYTTVDFTDTTAVFSNARIEDNTLIVKGTMMNDNTLITKG